MNEVIKTHSPTGKVPEPNWGAGVNVRLKMDQEKSEIAEWINKMTNWQRSQWARAGYKRDLESVKKFCGLQRYK